jgi:hypothetical protein
MTTHWYNHQVRSKAVTTVQLHNYKTIQLYKYIYNYRDLSYGSSLSKGEKWCRLLSGSGGNVYLIKHTPRKNSNILTQRGGFCKGDICSLCVGENHVLTFNIFFFWTDYPYIVYKELKYCRWRMVRVDQFTKFPVYQQLISLMLCFTWKNSTLRHRFCWQGIMSVT